METIFFCICIAKKTNKSIQNDKYYPLKLHTLFYFAEKINFNKGERKGSVIVRRFCIIYQSSTPVFVKLMSLNVTESLADARKLEISRERLSVCDDIAFVCSLNSGKF